MNLRREQDINVVRLAAELALRENQRLVEISTRLRKENLHLRGLDPAQLQQELALLDKQLEREATKLNEDFEKGKAAAEEAKAKPVKKPRARSGPREQPKLEVIEVAHPLDEADKVCAR